MKRLGIKATSGILSGVLLLSTVIVPIESAFASSIVKVQENDDVLFTDEEIQSMEEFFMNYDEDEFYRILEIAVNETKSEFIDPSVAEEILNKESNDVIVIVPYGKVTLTAKAGAKAIKATMSKVGKTGWNKMIGKIESMTGTQLAVLHWESINKFLDFAVSSGGTIEDALTSFLVKKGHFNKTVATYISKAFVLIVF
ncbi:MULTISPECIES: hypothetical protein [Peribacillus]|uniref:Uncharacterized protein n=1 Tax=Peribacillus simplex TaxID=1478 RepID=A0A109MY09_9BACI|nr:hypothetical protein [Peribacillus simplex]KWW18865.1 hypothetical protein AS888_19685 [Peribacillus simplex]